LKNFGSKIFGGITEAAGWVAPTLNKVLGTLAAQNEAVIVDLIRNKRVINFPTQVIRTQSSNYPASNIAD
ncbi:MAG: hypothetical protein EZS28_008154, partial [Streblomastix strix]